MDIFDFILIGAILFLLIKEQIPFYKNKKEQMPLTEKAEEITPMTLRNGYGVTPGENPTFAEQWVNIMNYNGENQREEIYEEAETAFSAGNLE